MNTQTMTQEKTRDDQHPKNTSRYQIGGSLNQLCSIQLQIINLKLAREIIEQYLTVDATKENMETLASCIKKLEDNV